MPSKRKKNFQIYLLLNLIFILSLFSFSKKQVRILPINSSVINLVINAKGSQEILNNTFYSEPTNVIVNGVSMPSCKKNCTLPLNSNNVTLIFEENINSCENMFYGLINLTTVDLSNFDASHVTNMNSMFQKCEKLEKITF